MFETTTQPCLFHQSSCRIGGFFKNPGVVIPLIFPNGSWQFCDHDPHSGIVKWPELKGCWWLPTRGSTGHFESPGCCFTNSFGTLEKDPRVLAEKQKIEESKLEKHESTPYLMNSLKRQHSHFGNSSKKGVEKKINQQFSKKKTMKNPYIL